MMAEYNNEQEIDLKDLSFSILRKWRIVISVTVLLGIIFGGYKYIAERSNMEASEIEEVNQIYNEELELYNKKKSAYKKQLEGLEDRIFAQEEYLANSTLMSISPYRKPIATADIFVKISPQEEMISDGIMSDNADVILNSYVSILNNTVNTVKFEDKSGNIVNTQYLRELISTDIKYKGNVIKVEITYNNEVEAKEILNMMLEKVNEEYATVQSKLGNHELIIMNVNTAIITDETLAGAQKDSTDFLQILNRSKVDIEKALDELVAPSGLSQLSLAGSLKVAVKYGVLGALLGAFLAVFCISVVFLMSNKLDSEKEIKSRYGLRVLGVFSKHQRNRIDRWLDRLQGKKYRQPAEVYEMIAANIENYITNTDNLMISGVTSGEGIEQIAQELRMRIPDLEIQVAENIGNSAETLKLLPKAGQFILVEERGVSRHDEIQNQIEMIKSLDKKILGCIVL